jgi:hypothetical protein
LQPLDTIGPEAEDQTLPLRPTGPRATKRASGTGWFMADVPVEKRFAVLCEIIG